MLKIISLGTILVPSHGVTSGTLTIYLPSAISFCGFRTGCLTQIGFKNQAYAAEG